MNTSNTPDPAILDTDQLEPFIEIGLTDFLDILNDVVTDVPLQLERIHIAIRDENTKDFRACTHSLRGMLANFGFVGMTAALHHLEHGDPTPPNQADQVKLQLETIWQESLVAIKQWEKSIPEFLE